MAAIDHAELADLVAVYSLDALPPEEVALVERHLAGCPRCRAELASLREVAGMLGNAGASAPEGTWDRIANELEPTTGRTGRVLRPAVLIGPGGRPRGVPPRSGLSPR